MSLALVPQQQGRPAIVQHQGGFVYVGLHDAFYLHEHKAWKRRLASAHPDAARRSSGQEPFIARHRQYLAWLKAEQDWYARLNLQPPTIQPQSSYVLKDIEAEVIRLAVQRAKGHQKLAARWLGISEHRLRRKMVRHGIPTRRLGVSQ